MASDSSSAAFSPNPSRPNCGCWPGRGRGSPASPSRAVPRAQIVAVDVEVHRNAVTVDERLGEVAHELDALRARQLLRDRNLVVASDAGILPLLRGLGGVPQGRAIACPGRRTRRHDELGVHDVALAGVVVHLAGPLIDDELSGAISRGGGRGATVGTADRLDGEMVHRGERSKHWIGISQSAIVCGSNRTDSGTES